MKRTVRVKFTRLDSCLNNVTLLSRWAPTHNSMRLEQILQHFSASSSFPWSLQYLKEQKKMSVIRCLIPLSIEKEIFLTYSLRNYRISPLLRNTHNKVKVNTGICIDIYGQACRYHHNLLKKEKKNFSGGIVSFMCIILITLPSYSYGKGYRVYIYFSHHSDNRFIIVWIYLRCDD